MLVFLDTNILISAALNPEGTPARAFLKAVSAPNSAVTSEYNIQELQRIFTEKLAKRVALLDSFLSYALLSMTIVEVPSEPFSSESEIRDVADWPILRAALAARADILLTGDKDFLDSGLQHPQILTAAEFLSSY